MQDLLKKDGSAALPTKVVSEPPKEKTEVPKKPFTENLRKRLPEMPVAA